MRPVPSRQILFRIGWLLALLAALAVSAVLGLRQVEKNTIQEIVEEEEQEHGRLLDGVVELSGNPLRLLVEAYARRTVFTRPDDNDNAARARSILETGVRLYNLDAAWILEANGAPRMRVAGDGRGEMPPPIEVDQLVHSRATHLHYFVEYSRELYEVRGRRLLTPKGGDTAAAGWIFAAYHLNATNLASPQFPVEGHVSLEMPAAAAEPPQPEFPVRIDRSLNDFQGRPLRILRVKYRPDEIDVTVRAGDMARLLIAIFVLLSLAVLGFTAWRWVVRPAMLMQASLAVQDVKVLAPLFAAGGDLARLAGFVRQGLENQESLRATLEERARLGRDLHDGVIQTIYSAGLGLARVRNHLQSDPAKADALLLEVRASLDDAVKELRRHIDNIEPESTLREGLLESLRKLKVLAHLEPSVTVDFEIDPAADALLGRAQRAEILFFASEAFSNGLRHGRATLLKFKLILVEGPTLELEASDNGTGFAPAESRNPFGQGLSNLRQRAVRLGGELVVETSPESGTRLSLKFSPQ